MLIFEFQLCFSVLQFGLELLNGTNFRKELNKIVWDVLIDPEQFEFKWNILMEDYSLIGDKCWSRRCANKITITYRRGGRIQVYQG